VLCEQREPNSRRNAKDGRKGANGTDLPREIGPEAEVGSGVKVSPCMASTVHAMAVDEHLNVHRCPGRLYQEPDAIINPQGELVILRDS